MAEARPMLHLVEEKNYVRVLQMIQGGVDPNKSYLGVSSLSLAVEAGDVDMVALLIDWKADPLHKHGTQTPSAMQLAETMSQNPKCAHRLAAKEMLEVMADPKVLKARLKGLEATIFAQRAADQRKAQMFAVVCAVIAAVMTFFYKNVVAALPNEAKDL